jgi:hypothetical protein
VAELADALDLGSSSFGSAGSIPVVPTFFDSKDLRQIDFGHVSACLQKRRILGETWIHKQEAD